MTARYTTLRTAVALTVCDGGKQNCRTRRIQHVHLAKHAVLSEHDEDSVFSRLCEGGSSFFLTAVQLHLHCSSFVLYYRTLVLIPVCAVAAAIAEDCVLD